jgi:hypothetical protein
MVMPMLRSPPLTVNSAGLIILVPVAVTALLASAPCLVAAIRHFHGPTRPNKGTHSGTPEYIELVESVAAQQQEPVIDIERVEIFFLPNRDGSIGS